MKRNIKITINKVAYPLDFGYRSARLLGSYLGEDSYDGTYERVGTIMVHLAKLEKAKKLESGQLTFEMLDTLGYLILSLLPEDAEVKLGEAVDFVLKDMEKFSEVMEAWVESVPQGKEQKKTTGPSKKGSPRKKD